MTRRLTLDDDVHRLAAPLEAERWQPRLAALVAEHGVPGAALGVLRIDPGGADQSLACAAGVLNLDTGVEVTPDSVFQTGSITKVWTATVIMQLVEEGRLDLDAPVVDVLPDLRLSDSELTKQVTMRHLLSHTSGIDGDVIADTGRGDDCIERYVAGLDSARINHPLGATFSYCNTGYIIAGRVIEVLTGMSWDAAIAERLVNPLGLRQTGTLPEDALRFRAAAGHLTSSPGEQPHVAPTWMLPRSLGPAGLINSTVDELLAFARLHLTGGLAADGTRLLGAAAVATMQQHEIDLPDPHSLGDSWGLGWIRYGWDGHRLVGHDGGTIGQTAYLRLVPEQGLAICLMTNGGRPHDLAQDLLPELFAEIAGIAVPAPIEPPEQPPVVEVDRHLGTYERTAARTEIRRTDAGRLVLRATTTGPLVELLEATTEEYDLLPVAENLFAIRTPGSRAWSAVQFYQLSDGSPYVHYHGRANPKVS